MSYIFSAQCHKMENIGPIPIKLQDLWSLNDEIAAQREALAGDQAQYGAQSEYGAASAPIGGET